MTSNGDVRLDKKIHSGVLLTLSFLYSYSFEEVIHVSDDRILLQENKEHTVLLFDYNEGT